MRNTNKKGFTIVELVIVIAVVAVLAAVLIPTFAGLIDQANKSVDYQFADQLNKILTAESIVDGKPANVHEAKEVLANNGIAVFTATHKKNTFYWSLTDNTVFVWTWDDNAQTTGKVTYPKNLANSSEYNTFTKPSSSWVRLDLDSAIKEVEESTAAGLANAIESAIADSTNKNVVIKLPAKAEITTTDLTAINTAMKSEANATITIDLNGGSLVDDSLEDGDTVTDRTKDRIEIPEGASLIISNGYIKSTTRVDSLVDRSSFSVGTGASLVLRDLELDICGAIFPAKNASEIIIENCNIKSQGYAVATRNGSSENVKVTIKNSTLESTGGCAVLINAPSNVDIVNSTIIGATHGLLVREGTVNVTDTTIKLNATGAAYEKVGEFSLKQWGAGYDVAISAVVIGDNQKPGSGYKNVKVAFNNVKVESVGLESPFVLLASGKTDKVVEFTYEGGNITDSMLEIHGYEGYTNEGTITVNGETK